MSLGYLIAGLGLGFIGGWLISRKPIVAENSQPLELAYRSLLELSQFKAGFLARTSHELRSPLNGLIGAQQLILEDLCESPEEEREFLTQANQSALKLVKLLDEVIHVSKAEYGTGTLELQSVSVADVFDHVFCLTHLLAENRNLRFQFVLPEPDLQVVADRRSLEQVLTSLISSAIATLQDGALKLSAQADSKNIYIDLEIDLEDERPIAVWQEAIDLLKTAASPDLDPPSLGFSLLLNQSLMELMNGRLEFVKMPTETGETVTQIRCALPRNEN
ncbi:MAG TPA: HAMP domain-containing sensor histidine kinase [Leptolyngbya sp.]|jgi:signal transduction histidine kinase|nr:HAMP domain-containing sensor histidine kinase [Leptolyngbya sp.]